MLFRSYVCIMSAYFALWQWSPVFSLLFFITYSAYHFGESEMVEMHVPLDSLLQKLYAFIIGLSILLFIIFSHLETSILVLNSIHGVSSFLEGVDFYSYKNVVLAVSYFSIIPIWWMSKKTCIYLMLILVLGMQMPLMLAFGLYFVGSHSINA